MGNRMFGYLSRRQRYYVWTSIVDQRRVWAGSAPLFVVKCDRSQRLVAHSRLHSELKEVIGMATQNATRQILSRSFLQEAQDWHRRVGRLACSRRLIASGAYSHVHFVSLTASDPVHKGELSHLLSHQSHGSSRCDRSAACIGASSKSTTQSDSPTHLKQYPGTTLPCRSEQRAGALSSRNVGIPTAWLASEHLSEEALARSSGQSLDKVCVMAVKRRRLHKVQKMQPNSGSYAL